MALSAVQYISLAVPMTVTQIWLPGATIEAKISLEAKNSIEAKILGHCRRDDHSHGLAE
jgi:hypothetical protein